MLRCSDADINPAVAGCPRYHNVIVSAGRVPVDCPEPRDDNCQRLRASSLKTRTEHLRSPRLLDLLDMDVPEGPTPEQIRDSRLAILSGHFAKICPPASSPIVSGPLLCLMFGTYRFSIRTARGPERANG